MGSRKRIHVYGFHLLNLYECTLLFLPVKDSPEEDNSFCGGSCNSMPCISKGGTHFFGNVSISFWETCVMQKA